MFNIVILAVFFCLLGAPIYSMEFEVISLPSVTQSKHKTLLRLGIKSLHVGDYKRAHECFISASQYDYDQFDPTTQALALALLAQLYYFGWGVDKDPVRVKELTLSAVARIDNRCSSQSSHEIMMLCDLLNDKVNDPFALHHAAEMGMNNVAFFLLRGGCTLSALDLWGQDPFYLAVISDHKELVDLFMSSGVSWAMLHYAIFSGDLEQVRSILYNDKDCLGKRDVYGLLPMHLAAITGSQEVFDLCSAGVDLNEEDNYSRTPLYFAAMNRHLGLAEHLINSGANMCKEDFRGETVLHHSLWSHYLVKLLLERGAPVEMPRTWLSDFSSGYTTPLMIAAGWHDPTMVAYLLQRGAFASAQNEYGSSPLHYACMRASREPDEALEISRLLLEADADVNATTCYGETPLRFTCKAGSLPLVTLLLSKGSKVDPKTLRHAQKRAARSSWQEGVNAREIVTLLEVKIEELKREKESSWFYSLFRRESVLSISGSLKSISGSVKSIYRDAIHGYIMYSLVKLCLEGRLKWKTLAIMSRKL